MSSEKHTADESTHELTNFIIKFQFVLTDNMKTWSDNLIMSWHGTGMTIRSVSFVPLLATFTMLQDVLERIILDILQLRSYFCTFVILKDINSFARLLLNTLGGNFLKVSS